MKAIIYKHALAISSGLQRVRLPKSAIIRHFNNQSGRLVFWPEHSPADNELVDWHFRVVPTGEQFDPEGLLYCGTVLFPDMFLVCHIYGACADA